MLTRFLILSVVTVVATQAASGGWNELVRGKGIFGDEINTIQDKSSEDLVEQFRGLLNEEGVLETLYSNYQSFYSKDGPTPKEYKMTVFKNNLIDIAAHNLAAQNGDHSWFKGVNQFTDMTEQELDSTYSVNVSAWSNMVTPTPADQLPVSSILSTNPADPPPDALDWGTSGAVTSVKDQNQCNSCVMFAFTAQLEAVKALTIGKVTPELSPQECLDCAVRNFVCSDPGTDPMDTLRYLTNYGVTTWEKYPYPIPPKKLTCRAVGRARAAKVNQNGVVQNVEEETLKEYLATYGPLMVTIYSGYSYDGGILDNSACGNNRANHAVTLVGYGTQDGVDYWKIKNSYGPNWGEQGYLFLRRNNGHACAIGSYAFIVTSK